ncbi:MAG: SUMF1/EgtB/PvdO family nonheme iron enzyme, partial [bacterium]|nr:SUMF1/EgtB/PvdO family nonheme iron enzyme [bacterium]
DIHFRPKKDQENKTFREKVQNKLIEAVGGHTKTHGGPDAVVVTGDIAFSGKMQEYDDALAFFVKLKELLPDGTPFLPVPGNHDVDRSKVKKLFSLYRIVKDNEINSFLEDKDYIKSFINIKFDAYRAFVEQLAPGLYQSEGDYFWVKKVEDKKISFLGLNSAWACQGDDDQSNIALGEPQVAEALDRAKEMDHRILLMHHPPVDWLKDMETGRAELFEHTKLLLHGHSHSDNALVFKDPAHACICLGANASYTAERDGFIGFQFMTVDFSHNGTAVEVWPYHWHNKRKNFVPDRERWKGQDGKAFFKIDSLQPVHPVPPSVKPSLKIPVDYIRWVEEFHSTLPTDQLAKKGETVMISLPKVYVSLETANPFQKPMENKREKEGEEDEPKEPSSIDIEELVGRKNCLMLRGTAGMGKTTLIKHLAYILTQGSGPAALDGYLPVLVFLKDLWPLYKKAAEEGGGIFSFETLLEGYFKKSNCPLSLATVTAFLAQDRVLFLLDGLDEVPDAIRSGLVDLVHGFQFAHHKNRFVITGRPHGIEGRGMHCFGKNLHDIGALDDTKRDTFISKWFRAVSGQAVGYADVTAGDMISDIGLHEHAAVFTGNPLLLTALCIFYLVGGKRIPDQRADLYDRIVSNLLYRRFHDPADTEKVNRVREYLMLLAFTMQTGHAKSFEPSEAKAVLKEKYTKKKSESPSGYKKRIDKLFDGIEPVCGLLNRLSSGEIEFAHLSFQEFLAGKHMLDMDMGYKKYLEDGWWEETLLLYLGLMNLEMKKRSNGIVEDLLNSRQLRLQFLGAKALRDFQASKRETAIVDLSKEKLIAIIGPDVSLEDRFQAGDILGTLGDLRIQSSPMVHVDAGEFTRGSADGDEDSYDDEKPVRRIYLDEFEIGTYPVTNLEYKVFIENKGYETEDFWTPEGWEWRKEENILEPKHWHDRKWNGANFPVVGVSWFEAAAYAKWLSQKTGDNYSLPTEAQWEKAARGPDGLNYPWGKNFDKNLCNSSEGGLGRTSPVGIFPGGESPNGCVDMAGNVREWCSDWFGEEYYDESPLKNPKGPTDGSNRVFRGGGWFNDAHYCRAAYRLAGNPGARWIDFGFRLARFL